MKDFTQCVGKRGKKECKRRLTCWRYVRYPDAIEFYFVPNSVPKSLWGKCNEWLAIPKEGRNKVTKKGRTQ